LETIFEIIKKKEYINVSFINKIKTLSNNYKFYDIEPENAEIVKQDFLLLDYNQFKNKYPKIHVIGNPPFGRQASLAIKFIKNCCDFATTISFILPKSFKKSSMQKHFTNNYHLIHEIDLIDNSFLVNNIDTDVPCVFQIWEYKVQQRNLVENIEPVNFKFVKQNENPDISFRRVGVNAGIIAKEINNKSIQSHYFIKFLNNKTVDENIKKIR